MGKCWACQRDIVGGQLKCLECESWQNWRRFANVSNTTLSLLIALTSVGSILVANGANLYREWYPIYDATYSGHVALDGGFDNFRLVAFVENLGTANFSMPSGLSCTVSTSKGAEYLFLTAETNTVVRPNDFGEVVYSGSIGLEEGTSLGSAFNCDEQFITPNGKEWSLRFETFNPSSDRVAPWRVF